jgi:hypothetical protein
MDVVPNSFASLNPSLIETWQERSLAKIDYGPGIARFDFVEFSNIDNGAGGSRAT